MFSFVIVLTSLACVAGGISCASAFVFGSEAVNASGKAVRGLVKSTENMAAPPPLARLRIPPATQAMTSKKTYVVSPNISLNETVLLPQCQPCTPFCSFNSMVSMMQYYSWMEWGTVRIKCLTQVEEHLDTGNLARLSQINHGIMMITRLRLVEKSLVVANTWNADSLFFSEYWIQIMRRDAFDRRGIGRDMGAARLRECFFLFRLIPYSVISIRSPFVFLPAKHSTKSKNCRLKSFF